MKLFYYIKDAGEWKQASYDEYQAFDGQKEIRSPTWGLMLLDKLLRPYRW